MKQVIIEESPRDGRGIIKAPTKRALTLAEQLYHASAIDVDEWLAAGNLRNLWAMLQPPSEGISSYGDNVRQGDPTRKADRKARRLTGMEVLENGAIERGPSRSNRSTHWRYRDAVFAMAGLHTEEGEKVIDPVVVNLMVRAVTETENMPTQTEIGQARTILRGNKQITAVGSSFVREHLKRLALHFKLIKGREFR